MLSGSIQQPDAFIGLVESFFEAEERFMILVDWYTEIYVVVSGVAC